MLVLPIFTWNMWDGLWDIFLYNIKLK